jgi:hypothetical protein
MKTSGNWQSPEINCRIELEALRSSIRARFDRTKPWGRDRELFEVLSVLLDVGVGDNLSEPFVIEHMRFGGGPDIILSTGKTRIGIEVTVATHPELEWASHRVDELGSGVDFSAFRYSNWEFTEPRKGRTRPMGIFVGRLPNSRPFIGMEVERDWCKYMMRSLGEKQRKSHNYEHCDANYLLLIDHTPARICTKIEYAANLLNGQLDDYWEGSAYFDGIFVRSSETLFRFTPGKNTNVGIV